MDYINQEVKVPNHDSDVTMVLPNGETVQVQFRPSNASDSSFGSLDIILPDDKVVTCWKGDHMEPAMTFTNRKHVLLTKQLVMDLPWNAATLEKQTAGTGETAKQGRPYRKRPVIIRAIQWTGDNIEEVMMFMSPQRPEDLAQFANADELIGIQTLEGLMVASVNDYIIRGVQDELYPCKPDIFAKTYELVE